MRKKEDGMLIGTNALNGKGILLSKEDFLGHFHILGNSGVGKSKLLEEMMRFHIRNKHGLCLLDPHGDLYKNMLAYLTVKRMTRKVILIDPDDEEWAVGLNFLEYDPKIRSSTSHASMVMRCIAKVSTGTEPGFMPRLQRWERNALVPLIEKRHTLVELAPFVDPRQTYLRKLILAEFDDHLVIDEWERFEQAPPSIRETYVEAVLNRANKFTAGRDIRRIFGQLESTVDFRKAMDEGMIILCNLSSNKLSDEEKGMLGRVIIDKIIQAAKSRVDIPEHKRRPFHFYLDEFGLYVSEDFATALQELRKFRVYLKLAHQELEQLREDNRKVYSAVMSEPLVKISFRISREDAEVMMKEMFTGKIRGDREKRRIEQTKFKPVKTYETIETDTDSWSDHDSQASSSGFSHSFINAEDGVTLTTSFSTNSSHGSGSTYGGSHSRSVVPFYDHDEFKEVSNIADFSIEEICEKFIAWIKNQPDRHFQLKIGQHMPVPIEAPFVKPCTPRERDIQALKEKVYSRCALPVEEVDKMLEDRRMEFLKIAESMGLLEGKKRAVELTAGSMRHRHVSVDQLPIQDISFGRGTNAEDEERHRTIAIDDD